MYRTELLCFMCIKLFEIILNSTILWVHCIFILFLPSIDISTSFVGFSWKLKVFEIGKASWRCSTFILFLTTDRYFFNYDQLQGGGPDLKSFRFLLSISLLNLI